MARARNIKPGFFTNDALGDLNPLARILFIGIWCHADRAGRLLDRPKKLKAEVLPYDNCDPNQLIQDLHGAGMVQRYEVAGIKYIQCVNFTKHQNPHIKEPESTIPAPDLSGAKTADSLILIPDSGLPHTGLRKPSKSKATPRPAGATLPDWIDPEAWQGFVDMRKKLRAPMTDHAVGLIIKKLATMKAAGQDPAAVLNQSTERGWKGIFEVATGETKANGKMAWWATESGILSKGAEFGLTPRPGESMPQFKSRINERIA